jgi:hypothetical protein
MATSRGKGFTKATVAACALSWKLVGWANVCINVRIHGAGCARRPPTTASLTPGNMEDDSS